jgi:hypothetical protein
VTPGSFVISWTPSPLESDERLLLFVSRQFNAAEVLAGPDAAAHARPFVAVSTGIPKCGRCQWLLTFTDPGAASPVDVFSEYALRFRVPYPGQCIVLRWRLAVDGDVTECNFVILTVGA